MLNINCDEFPDNTCQKDHDGQRIDKMHNPDVDIIWTAPIFFSKKVHKQI